MVIYSFKKVLLLVCLCGVAILGYSFILLHKENKFNNLDDTYIMCKILLQSPNFQALLLLGKFQDSVMSIIKDGPDSINFSFLVPLSVAGIEFRIGTLTCKVAYYDSILRSMLLIDSGIIGLNDKLHIATVTSSIAQLYFWKENHKKYYLCYRYYIPFWFKREIVLSTDEQKGIKLQVSKVNNIKLSKVLYYVNLPILSLLSNERANIEKHIICGKLYSASKEKFVYNYLPCDSILKDTINNARFIYIDLVPKDSLLFLYHFKGLFVIDDSFGDLIDIKDSRKTLFIPYKYMVNLKYSYNSWMKITRAIDSKYEVCTLYDVPNDSIYILLPLF